MKEGEALLRGEPGLRFGQSLRFHDLGGGERVVGVDLPARTRRALGQHRPMGAGEARVGVERGERVRVVEAAGRVAAREFAGPLGDGRRGLLLRRHQQAARFQGEAECQLAARPGERDR